jgi:hypothetical protein
MAVKCEGMASMDTQYFDFGAASQETKGAAETIVPDNMAPPNELFHPVEE